MLKRFNQVLLIVFVLIINVSAQRHSDVFPEIPPSVLSENLNQDVKSIDPMQSRMFRTTDIRKQINLAGFWNFITDPDSTGEEKNYHGSFPKPETQLWVPGTWNCIPRYWQYQKPAWYQRMFYIPEKGNLHIRFESVFYLAKVWFDGQLLGEHEGGYSPFTFDIPDVSKGDHELIVCVDNSLNDETLPKDGVDWFPYGGIYRPVYVELISDPYIDNFHLIPSEISENEATFNVKAFIKSIKTVSITKDVSLFINGKRYYSQNHEISATNSSIQFEITIEKPRLWSPETPYLYLARLVLGNEDDDLYTRFGIREFTTKDSEIYLNGERFKLMGANHHDDHPDWGSALPPHIIRQDIEIYKRMRANAARGHYPPSEMFMDFCDEYGIVFMNEVPSWQYRPEQMANPVVKEKIKKQYFDMVYRDMNHPAIFSWSLGNEWREFEKSYDDIKELVDYARTIDQSHFITFIAGGAHVDRSYELIDIICTNWSKYQWYWNPTYKSDSSDDRPKSTILNEDVGKESIRRLKKIHEIYPNKPIILTEFGGSGSQAGWHNWGNVKWSEEYQARNVWDSGLYGLETDWISGGCVWQFCDTRTTQLRMLGPRLRGWNVKGVVDGYRQPKMAFYKLQELFSRYNSLIVPSQ